MTGKQSSSIYETVHKKNDSHAGLLLVAEGLHVLNQQVYRAITESDRDRLLSLARRHLRHGAQALAVNLGTGKKMAELTPWVVTTLIDTLDACLFVSANLLDHPETLQRFGNRIVINAVSAAPTALARAMEAAQSSGSGLVVLLVRPGLTPSGVEDRLELAADVVDTARMTGLDPERLYIDPVLSCRPDPHAMRISRGLPDIGVVSESITLIKDLWPGIKTIVGLGTSTQTFTGDRRGRMQGSITSLLVEAGLDAVIMDCQNSEHVRRVKETPRLFPSGEPAPAVRNISRAA